MVTAGEIFHGDTLVWNSDQYHQLNIQMKKMATHVSSFSGESITALTQAAWAILLKVKACIHVQKYKPLI